MYDSIIVPLDGSELSEQALPEAVKIAKLAGDPIFLIRVVDHTNLRAYDPRSLNFEDLSIESAVEEEERESREYLEKLSETLKEQHDVQVDTGVVRGPVTRAIIAAALPDDLIVLASHGRGGFSRFLLGSTAEDIVRYSEVPLLLIRPKNDT